MNIKNLALITLGIFIAYSIFFIKINFMYHNNLDTNSLKSSKISGKILINGNSGWANAKITGVCSGSGTDIDPYIIEDLVIDGGGSESCILIQNSDVSFKIINCTLSNSGEEWGDGGIRLSYIENGYLINNSVTFCYEGIILDSCNYINISGNTANSNTYVGIGLWYSYNNSITKNTFRSNGWGISLESSNFNNITENKANNNKDDGIGIWNSINNFVSGNNVKENRYHGLFLYNSDCNNISGNDIISNTRGIYLEESDSNYIAVNNIRNNEIGIYITHSKCNDILNNIFTLNQDEIRGTQDECIPDNVATSPFPIQYVLIPVMIIVSIVLLTGLLRMKRRPLPHKDMLFEKSIVKFQEPEKLVREVGLEPEIKSELISTQEVEKLDNKNLSTLDELSLEEEISFEDQVGRIPEDQKEEIIPSNPQISNCPFCGLEINDNMTFCPQCGNPFKKK